MGHETATNRADLEAGAKARQEGMAIPPDGYVPSVHGPLYSAAVLYTSLTPL